MKSLSDDQQAKNTPLCLKCKHYIKNSCGANCGSTHGVDKLKKLINSETIEFDINTKKNTDQIIGLDLDSYKHACQVVMNCPSDFDVVDPFKCKYFFPNSLKLY